MHTEAPSAVQTIILMLSSTLQLLDAMSGKPNVVECTYVQSDETEAQYFSTPWLLGKNGLEKNLGMGRLSDYEKSKLEEVWNQPCL